MGGAGTAANVAEPTPCARGASRRLRIGARGTLAHHGGALSTEIEAIQGRLHSAIKGSFGREARRNDTHAFTDADVPVLLFSRARRLLRWAEIRLYDAMQSFLWPLL